MIEGTTGCPKGPLGEKGPFFPFSKDVITYTDIAQQGSSNDIEKIFKSKELEKETEMIELVRKLVLERVEELLDGKIDDIVKILVENKLFEDENIGLKKQVEDLNNRISTLEVTVGCLLAQTQNQWYKTYYGTTGTGTGTGVYEPVDINKIEVSKISNEEVLTTSPGRLLGADSKICLD